MRTFSLSLSMYFSYAKRLSPHIIYSSSAHYSDFEGLMPHCPRPMTRWKLNNSPLDRSVYSGKWVMRNVIIVISTLLNPWYLFQSFLRMHYSWVCYNSQWICKVLIKHFHDNPLRIVPRSVQREGTGAADTPMMYESMKCDSCCDLSFHDSAARSLPVLFLVFGIYKSQSLHVKQTVTPSTWLLKALKLSGSTSSTNSSCASRTCSEHHRVRVSVLPFRCIRLINWYW